MIPYFSTGYITCLSFECSDAVDINDFLLQIKVSDSNMNNNKKI